MSLSVITTRLLVSPMNYVGSGSQKSGESSSAVTSQATSWIEVSWQTAGVCVRDTAPFTMIRPINSRCERPSSKDDQYPHQSSVLRYPIQTRRRWCGGPGGMPKQNCFGIAKVRRRSMVWCACGAVSARTPHSETAGPPSGAENLPHVGCTCN